MMRYWGRILGVCLGVFLFVWVRSLPKRTMNSSQDKRLTVITTQTIFADWVREIGGNRVNVIALVGPEGDAHHVEATPKRALELARADVLVEMGLGLEDEWLPALYASTKSRAKRVQLSQGLSVLRAGPALYSPDSQPVFAGPGDEPDPHLWLDVAYAKQMVQTLHTVLCALDPKGVPHYDANFQHYTHVLDQLHSEVSQQMQTIPEHRRYVVTHHDCLRYFTKAYGLTYLGNALGSGVQLLSGAPAGHLAKLAGLIRQYQVPALFPEKGESPVLLKQLAAETGSRLAPFIHVSSLSVPEGPAATYVQLMRHLAQTLVEGLAQ